jgi:16S rRNA processing protein RimM
VPPTATPIPPTATPSVREGDIVVRGPGVVPPVVIYQVEPEYPPMAERMRETGLVEAEALIGADMFIPETELPALDEDTYYWFELIGLEVYTTEEDYLGRITSIFETGSNDVYVVKDKKREVLIPALESVVIDIDLELKRMRVDLPEGLE